MRAAYLFAHLFENQESSMKPSEGHMTYIEFPAPSRESLHAARAFYGQAFGWMYQPWGDDYMDTAGSGIGSGMTCDHPPCKPLAVIYAADLEAACAKVRQAGGAITQEIFAFPGGRRFHFTDPAGNELAVWSDK